VLLVGGATVACSDADGDDAAGTTESTSSTTTAGSAGDETTTTAGDSLGEFPAQPEGVPWPTDEWAEEPWPNGVDQAEVDAATDTAFNDGAAERVRAVVIVHRGAIVYERYSPHPDDRRNAVMPSYSTTDARPTRAPAACDRSLGYRPVGAVQTTRSRYSIGSGCPSAQRSLTSSVISAISGAG
jgi:hypothetical protein